MSEHTTKVLASDIHSLDVTLIDNESKTELRAGTIEQLKRLADLGVISIVGVPKDRSDVFIIGMPTGKDSEDLYEMDLGQTVAFALGALSALEAARDYYGTIPGELLLSCLMIQGRVTKTEGGENNGR
jgi:hypothetical protein